MTFFESILEHEEPNIFSEMSGGGGGGGGGNNTNSLTSRLDPLEEILNIRLIDCREPKIPHDQFINEVANKHIDIQSHTERHKHMHINIITSAIIVRMILMTTRILI